MQAGAKLLLEEADKERRQAVYDAARTAVETLQGSAEFLLDELRLKQALAHAHNLALDAAKAMVEDQRTVEHQSRRVWYTSKYQHEALLDDIRRARRYWMHKRTEKSASDLNCQRIDQARDKRT